MTDYQFTKDILSTLMTVVLLLSVFAVCNWRAILSWAFSKVEEIFGYQDEYDEYGDYIGRK